MNCYLIAIGSNKCAEKMIQSAQNRLRSLFPTIIFGEAEETIPFGMPHDIPNFLNQLASFNSHLSPKEVENILKNIEKEMGRTVSDKLSGEILIDLDILKINERAIRPDELQRPYICTLLRKFKV